MGVSVGVASADVLCETRRRLKEREEGEEEEEEAVEDEEDVGLGLFQITSHHNITRLPSQITRFKGLLSEDKLNKLRETLLQQILSHRCLLVNSASHSIH